MPVALWLVCYIASSNSSHSATFTLSLINFTLSLINFLKFDCNQDYMFGCK